MKTDASTGVAPRCGAELTPVSSAAGDAEVRRLDTQKVTPHLSIRADRGGAACHPGYTAGPKPRPDEKK
jgi:hypothetical protein